MYDCAGLTRDMLTAPIDLQVGGGGLSFSDARERAESEARKRSSDPMLLAWYEGGTGRHSPTVECCSERKPGWLVYAEARGGDIVVDVNREEYVFVFRP